EPAAAYADVADGGVECCGVARRGRAVTAHLAHELQGGRLDLSGRRGLVRPSELLDASAHARTVARTAAARRRNPWSPHDQLGHVREPARRSWSPRAQTTQISARKHAEVDHSWP